MDAVLFVCFAVVALASAGVAAFGRSTPLAVLALAIHLLAASVLTLLAGAGSVALLQAGLLGAAVLLLLGLLPLLLLGPPREPRGASRPGRRMLGSLVTAALLAIFLSTAWTAVPRQAFPDRGASPSSAVELLGAGYAPVAVWTFALMLAATAAALMWMRRRI